AAIALRDARNEAIEKYKMTLRDIYRKLELPGKNPIKDLHKNLDNAVMETYGFDKDKDILQQLLDLNFDVAGREEKGEKVQPPGLPDWIENKKQFVTDDCVRFLTD
ncbi:MAG: hypothetical protein JW833_17400, partial [Prolixibacteraceae bacterium]|nr:hypothetical protein [Prolixibacteraceae bacterium]